MQLDAVVLSLHPWIEDGRVRRTLSVLLDAGLRCAIVAPARAVGSDPSGAVALAHHTVEVVSLAPLSWPVQRKVLTTLGFMASRLAPGEASALRLAQTLPGVEALTKAVAARLVQQSSGPPPLLIANDWTTLPAAIVAQDRFGCRLHYDTHEMAVAEHNHSRIWRLAFPHLIERIERAGVARAASVSCVSPGIARDMARRYAPMSAPAVIRNVPAVTALAPGPVGNPVTVLYHGLLKPDRGLIQLVESVRLWPERYRLVLRGAASQHAFGEAIREAIAAPSVAGRVTLEPLVPQAEVVRAANAADIGIFLPEMSSQQNVYALPNKLFEYMAAGLMTIVPAGSDMGDVVEATGAGLALRDPGPASLASALSGLTPADISRFKAAANRAALTHTSAAEAAKLRQILGI